jgi:1-deoxy-D-xylulose-5-phosphate synthase
MARIPFGKKLDRFLRKIKTGIKDALLPSSMFENMGFIYIGPADGHNIKEICRLLKVAKELSKPVLIHLTTTKGKGYKYAEERPEDFHGVTCFDINNGESNEAPSGTFASVFGESMVKLAGENERICAVTAAMQTGTGLDDFARLYPKRFFDVGIAEGHAVTMAGGLAKQGMIPVCAIYSTFIQRAYDMIFHDVCLSNLHVVFAIDRAGLVAEDGQTHQGIYDIGILMQMPNMTVLCPSGMSEMEQMLRYAVNNISGPAAIRYPRGGNNSYTTDGPPYDPVLLKKGKDIAIISYGRLIENTMEAAEQLDKQGISASVIKLTEITNIKISGLFNLLDDASSIFVIEECASGGSLASKLALDASLNNHTYHIHSINLGNTIVRPAAVDELMSIYSLDAPGIARSIINQLSLWPNARPHRNPR